MLREYLALGQKRQPERWRTFHDQSLLGGAVPAQKKYAEAESLLLAGYEGLKKRQSKISAHGKGHPAEFILGSVFLALLLLGWHKTGGDIHGQGT